jgi:membrane associated rhomboid family serine protease
LALAKNTCAVCFTFGEPLWYNCGENHPRRMPMIPLRDLNPSRRPPVVTVAIIVLNVVVFLLEFLVPSYMLNEVANTWGLVPSRLLSFEPMAFVTLFTSMFLHSGPAHLLGNMLYLWIFGDNIEGALGPLRFTAFYFLCGVGAALGQTLINPSSTIPMIGASGAISGVLGSYLVLYPRAQVETLLFLGYFVRLVRLPTLVVLGSWMFTQLLSGVLSLGMQATGGVAWFAHIGGFAAGVLLISLLRRRRWWE